MENQTLIDFIKQETKTSYEEYLVQVEKSTKHSWELLEKKSIWTYKQWLERYGVDYSMKRWVTEPDGSRVFKLVTDKIMSRKGQAAIDTVRRTLEKGFAVYLTNKLTLAKLHYESIVVKLAIRIEQKGIKLETLICKHSKVDQNIESVWEDTNSKVSVRTWTIIASGEVQQPHFRFLIK